MVSFRMQWSLSEAFWNTAVWTVVMLICTIIVSGVNQVGSLLSTMCSLAILPPIIYRWSQFYSMYGIHSVLDADGVIRLEVGHRKAFEERYNASLTGLGVPAPLKHALLLDNGLVVVSDTRLDLVGYERMLAESKNYRKYFDLISACDKHNVKLNFKGEISYSSF